jgi:spore germination protein
MRNSLNNEADKKQHSYVLSTCLEDNIKHFEERFADCPDIIRRRLYLKDNTEIYLVYIDGLVDNNLLQRDLIISLTDLELNNINDKKTLENLPLSNLNLHNEITSLEREITAGKAIFLVNGQNYGVSVKISKHETRQISEPITEKNIKGSHEGFVESLNINMSILRRNIQNNNLKFKMLNIGSSTNQSVAIGYIKGICNEELLNTLYHRISELNMDGVMAIGFIEQVIVDYPNSPFPQYQSTERPDKVMAGLLEGRMVIMLQGTPVTLIAPVTYFSFFQSMDDYSHNWIMGTFLGLLREFGMLLTLFLPALYISITSFHYYMVPLELLIPLAESRVRVPFSPIVETVVLAVVIELIHEASVRLPTYIGTTIGVVGGIIIGQAAVEAGIVSNLLIIVIAITATSSNIIPNEDMSLAIRLCSFIMLILSGIFGIIGIVVFGVLILTHLINLRSLGQPYFQPLIPFKPKDLKDTFVRLPLKYHKKRPDIAKPNDLIRGRKDE